MKRGRPKKQGTIYAHERSKQRRNDIKAAERAQELNADKVEVPLYGQKKPTTVLVPKSQEKQYWKRYRIAQAQDPKNVRKINFLKSKGWHQRADGIWMNRFEFLHKDFETALIMAKYYDHLKKELVHS